MGSESDAYRRLESPPLVGVAISKLATGQHEIVRLDQLRALGLQEAAVRRRVRSGFLHRVGRGVYTVGSPSLTQRGRWLAAVWSCGHDAALSHRSGAALHAIRRDARRRIDVTAPRSRHAPAGVDVHRSRSLEAGEVTIVDGIPVTTPARTLVDLADVLSPAAFRRAVHEAEFLQLHAPLVPIAGRRGHALVQAVAREQRGPARTRNALELAVLELIDRAGLPRPHVNHHVHAQDRLVERDFVWPQLRLVVEVDGFSAHTTKRAFEEDRRIDAELELGGWRVVRFTRRQVVDEPGWVARVIARLTLAGPPATIIP